MLSLMNTDKVHLIHNIRHFYSLIPTFSGIFQQYTCSVVMQQTKFNWKCSRAIVIREVKVLYNLSAQRNSAVEPYFCNFTISTVSFTQNWLNLDYLTKGFFLQSRNVFFPYWIHLVKLKSIFSCISQCNIELIQYKINLFLSFSNILSRGAFKISVNQGTPPPHPPSPETK